MYSSSMNGAKASSAALRPRSRKEAIIPINGDEANVDGVELNFSISVPSTTSTTISSTSKLGFRINF
jgi:hypothetical protein